MPSPNGRRILPREARREAEHPTSVTRPFRRYELPSPQGSGGSGHVPCRCRGQEIRRFLPGSAAGVCPVPRIPIILVDGEVPVLLVELEDPIAPADRAGQGLFMGTAQADPFLGVLAFVGTRDTEVLTGGRRRHLLADLVLEVGDFAAPLAPPAGEDNHAAAFPVGICGNREKVYGTLPVYIPVVRSMKDAELKALIKDIPATALKDEVKKRGIKMGRCPTKADYAKSLPEDVLKKLARK